MEMVRSVQSTLRIKQTMIQTSHACVHQSLHGDPVQRQLASNLQGSSNKGQYQVPAIMGGAPIIFCIAAQVTVQEVARLLHALLLLHWVTLAAPSAATSPVLGQSSKKYPSSILQSKHHCFSTDKHSHQLQWDRLPRHDSSSDHQCSMVTV